MAHVVNGRDGQPKKLGVKKTEGQTVKAGNIILKQRGMLFKPGLNVGVAKDHTIFALIDGRIEFDARKRVSVIPSKKS
jgi:large subunit ribosomal protein L27